MPSLRNWQKSGRPLRFEQDCTEIKPPSDELKRRVWELEEESRRLMRTIGVLKKSIGK